MALGRKTGGKQVGSIHKLTGYLQAREGHESPFVIMWRMIEGKFPCTECRGKKKLPYLLKGKERMRKCPSCHGTGYEAVRLEIIAKILMELAQYESPKRKAIEVTGEDGRPIEHTLELIIRD